MVVETEMSLKLGLISDSDAKYIIDILLKFNLEKHSHDLSRKEIVEHMKYDKKNKDGNINFVLLEGVGKPLIDYNVDEEIILEALKSITRE